MIDDVMTQYVLEEGLEDWVSLGELESHIQFGEDPSAPSDVRPRMRRVAAFLVNEGYVLLGNLTAEGFVAWPSKEDALARFDEILDSSPSNPMDRHDGAWFELTPAGADVARSLLRARRPKGTPHA